ncbi:MAG: replication initiator protein A [Lachnospirales bacterium]
MGTQALKLDYHYGTESESYSFYRIPKLLVTDKRFTNVSIDAKFLYGLMLDRMGLSMKNGWLDKDNKVFIYYTLEEVVEKLGCSSTKAVKLFSELDTVKGIGLIERKKQGQGKPTIIYVKSFSSLEKDVKTCENKKPEKDYKYKNGENKPQNQENQENSEQKEDLEVAESQNNKVLNLENQDSRNPKNEIQDFKKLDTNNTNTIYTDCSYTESINQSINQSIDNTNINTYNKPNQEEQKQNRNFHCVKTTRQACVPCSSGSLMIDGLMDLKTKRELENLVYNEMDEEKTLPYSYVVQPEKMEIAIRLMTDYNVYEKSAKADRECEFEFSVVNLFTEALTEMLTTPGNMTLKGSTVTYSKIYDKLVNYIDFSGYTPSLFSLLETVKRDFTIALKETEIKNYLQYMKACIWNAMQVGDIDVQAFVKRICP